MKNFNYKFIFLFIFLWHYAIRPVLADEGMWLPLLLSSLNEKDMKAKGMKISAEDIYSVNKTSLKDAVCIFAGGCTGELISNQGLLLTNHHCGYGAIQKLSSLQNNYLKNGFWAAQIGQELPAIGINATFLVRMQDVSQQILAAVAANSSAESRENIILQISSQISKKAVEGTHYKAIVRPFYYGSQYYLFVYEVFTDLRLVGTPAESMGNFGADTDNWVWPRHTADFSLFRIYAGPDNKPAPYSPSNKPYVPRKYLEISLKGIREGDFTMVMGFPGRTQQFLSSFALNIIMNKSNPLKVGLRAGRLDIINQAMQSGERLQLMYAAKRSEIANGWKKWSGENKGLHKAAAVQKKQLLEKEFMIWSSKNTERSLAFGYVLPALAQQYKLIDSIILPIESYNEAIMSIELLQMCGLYQSLRDSAALGKLSPGQAIRFENQMRGFYQNYDPQTDQKIMAFCLKTYYEKIPSRHHPRFFTDLVNKFDTNFDLLANYIYEKTLLSGIEKNKKLIVGLQNKNLALLDQDPAYMLAQCFTEKYMEELLPEYNQAKAQIELLNRTYVQGLKQMLPKRVFYPDANSTMRIAYGKIEGYQPSDAVWYDWQTNLDGLIEKANMNLPDYVLEPKLNQLYINKDYGRYKTKKNTIPVGFIASNHTTGGNSGSPVLDAYGRLIGTNFDRNWQGTMSDLMYDKAQCRNISLDIRYTMFIIEKIGKSSYLFDEMKIIE